MTLQSLYRNDILPRSSIKFSDEHTPKMKLFFDNIYHFLSYQNKRVTVTELWNENEQYVISYS